MQMLLRIIKLCAYYILNYRKLCLVKNGLNNDTNKVTKKGYDILKSQKKFELMEV